MTNAAAEGRADVMAMLGTGLPWNELTDAHKNAMREAYLPVIFHGTKILEDLGWHKDVYVTKDEVEQLPDGTAILTPGEIIFRKYDNLNGDGKVMWVRNEYGNSTAIPTEKLDADAHFPARILNTKKAS
jgi:hypothetical protein